MGVEARASSRPDRGTKSSHCEAERSYMTSAMHARPLPSVRDLEVENLATRSDEAARTKAR